MLTNVAHPPFCALCSVSLDQQRLGSAGAKIVSLAPGIIATDMQIQLRAADPSGIHKTAGSTAARILPPFNTI